MARDFGNRNMKNLYDYMRDEGTSGKNSAEFDNVFQALKLINTYNEQPIGRESRADLVAVHQSLMQACETYMEKKKGAWSSKGKERLDWVNAIYNLAKQESYADYDYSKTKEGATWGDVSADLRIKKIDISGKALDRAGTGASFRLKTDEGYFTENERTGANNLETAISDLSEEDANFVREHEQIVEAIIGQNESTRLVNFPDLGSNKEIEKLLAVKAPVMEKLAEKQFTPHQSEILYNAAVKKKSVEKTEYTRSNAVIQKGRQMGVRNVASSRLADLLGEPELLAKSEKMTVIDGDKTVEGVVMAAAKGIDARGKNKEQKELLAQVKDLDNPNLRRQIVTLNLMDFIAGQADRHGGNMFYQVETDKEGKPYLSGIQGIDNDLAFGNSCLNMDKKDAAGQYVTGAFGGAVFYRAKNHMFENHIGALPNIHLCDREFYDKVMSIDSKEQFKYEFKDVLHQDEIDSLYGRFTQVKDHLKSKEVTVVDDWSKVTREQMRSIKYYDNVKQEIASVKKELGYEVESVFTEEAKALGTEPQKEDTAKDSKAPKTSEPQKSETAKEVTPKKEASAKEKSVRERISLEEFAATAKSEKKSRGRRNAIVRRPERTATQKSAEQKTSPKMGK